MTHTPGKAEFQPLSRARLPADTAAMARFLIGKLLVRNSSEGRSAGRIVETEAYPPGDASGHAFRGETAANRSMFLEPGRAYVYFIYGVHFMLNVSAEPAGTGGGVLLRALEPVDGIELMRARRGPVRDRDLARGPGRLAQAMAVRPDLNGLDMCGAGPIWLAEAPGPVGEIGMSVRIGISKEAHQLRRYYERGNPYVSGPTALNRPDP
ncbi:DNA-3-methyladenine glycosylase [Emcibacter sp. SYSU 3D8]|uniref:DNA-3-methyladenine glycosylase n=1 Tax=Emcibacter sp. SYSU 3D8 TaxID=3133969 RepID=UPI0031FF0FB7